MEFFKSAVDALVALSGFVSWTIFLPQIRLLLRVKKSDNLSFGTVWGSLALQSLIITQSLLKGNWPLAFMISVNATALGCLIFLIYYYRKFPGGK